jgi:hypothetical protein
MMEMTSLDWKNDEDEVFLDYHCSYIQTDFKEKLTSTKLRKVIKPKGANGKPMLTEE